jgi:hypothetical protein
MDLQGAALWASLILLIAFRSECEKQDRAHRRWWPVPAVEDPCVTKGKIFRRGEARRNNACMTKHRPLDGAVLVSATICAAIRLRGQELKVSPKVIAVVSDSVQLARMVLGRLEK